MTEFQKTFDSLSTIRAGFPLTMMLLAGVTKRMAFLGGASDTVNRTAFSGYGSSAAIRWIDEIPRKGLGLWESGEAQHSDSAACAIELAYIPNCKLLFGGVDK